MRKLCSILTVAVMLTGCTAAPAATPSPTELPQGTPQIALVDPPPSLDPCRAVLVRLGTFTERMGNALSALRPLVIASNFDAAQTLAAVRRVSALVVVDSDLDAVLGACAAIGPLQERVKSLSDEAAAGVAASLAASLDDPAGQRRATVTLWKLLPNVILLSKATQGIAEEMGIALAVAQIPEGATEPLGPLPPIRTASATAAPSSGGGSTGSGGIGTPTTVQKYLDGVHATYDKMFFNEVWGDPNDPSLTGQERAVELAGAIARQAAYVDLSSHLAFMNAHPLACLADAYAADRRLASTFYAILDLGGLHAGLSFDQVENQRNAFYARLSHYVSDCH